MKGMRKNGRKMQSCNSCYASYIAQTLSLMHEAVLVRTADKYLCAPLFRRLLTEDRLRALVLSSHLGPIHKVNLGPAVSFVMLSISQSVCLSVRMEQRSSHQTDFHEIFCWKLY
jgi:hypothetical protein